MKSRFNSILFLSCLGSVLPITAFPADLWFLKNSPMFYFTKGDLKLQNDTAVKVLEDSDQQASAEWINPATGFSGRSQVLGDFRSADGMHCRKIKVQSKARGLESEFVFPVCKSHDGKWRIASDEALNAAT